MDSANYIRDAFTIVNDNTQLPNPVSIMQCNESNGAYYAPTLAMQERLFYAAQISRIQTEAKIALTQCDTSCKAYLVALRESYKEKRLERLEENRRDKEFATLGIFENSKENLCYELIAPDGRQIGTKILVRKSLKMLYV